ncbi:MAG: 50S ribosomal protein L17 [Bacteroidota bacterium]
MRHGKKVNHLGRKSAHRKAMLANMAISLIEHKRIKTTLAKAKALRVYVEPLITKSKTDTTHSRRVVFSYLQNKEAIKELFGEISETVASRPGGYTRILKLGPRSGDNAEMALIELVDFNEFDAGKAESGRKKKRRRRGKGNKKAAKVAAAVVEEVKETAEDVKDFVEDAVDKVEDVVEDVVDKVEDVVEDVADKVEDVVEDVKDKVEDFVEDVKEKVEDLLDGDDDKDDDDDKEEKED